MNEQILQPKSVVFTEQRVFTLGDERFKQSLPLIDRNYSRMCKDCRVTNAEDFGSESSKQEMELFFKNAYRLFEKRDVILADSRLSKAQLPFRRTFEGVPCLGDYLVWWKNYKCSQIEDEKGERYFIYNYFFKSSNCHYVDREGRTFSVALDASGALPASFAEARNILKSCSIYTGERDVCTLAQVIEILDILS